MAGKINEKNDILMQKCNKFADTGNLFTILDVIMYILVHKIYILLKFYTVVLLFKVSVDYCTSYYTFSGG